MPVLDAILGLLLIIVGSSESKQLGLIGWTAGAPLVLLPARLLWLLLLATLAVWKAGDDDSSTSSSRRKAVESCLQEAFFYAIFCLFSGICITRLITEKPASITAQDDLVFWAAIIGGAFFTSAETYSTLEVLPLIRKWSRRRHEARARRTGGLGTELLDVASGDSPAQENGPGTESGNGNGNAGDSADQTPQGEQDQEAGEAKPPTVKRLMKLLTPDWPLLVQATVLLLCAAVSEVLIPHYIGDAIGEITRAEEKGTLAERPFTKPVVKLIMAAVCCGIFSSCRGATFILMSGRASMRLRRELFDSLVSQEIGFFDTTKTGELTSRMTQDCQKVSDQVSLNVNVFLRTLVSTVTTLGFMLLLSRPLTAVSFIAVPAVVVMSKKYGTVMRKISERTQKALADANSVAEEGLSTMATVRSFAAEGLESQRFANKLSAYVKLVAQQARFYIVYLACTLMLPQGVTALVIFYGGKLAMEGHIKASNLVAFVFYLQTLNNNFSTLGDFYTNIVQALGAATRVFELIDRKPKLPLEPAPEDVQTLDKCCGTIRLEGIRFKYPARPNIEVLQGLTLEVPAGRVVALVGPSGNGKSTVMGLLKRHYKAHEGRVTLDGTDLWSFPHRDFHQAISIVGQEPVLYARNIRENILYGLENPKKDSGTDQDPNRVVSDEEVQDAAKRASAHSFIEQMPEAYATEVGERGVQLSGGQKQRIAIARAIVRRPKVLLLDEATSALDAESERQVQQAIDAMIADGRMTVVIIAHRLSTVRNSHKICVVKEGTVVQEGTHDELLAEESGAYFQLVQCQLNKDASH